MKINMKKICIVTILILSLYNAGCWFLFKPPPLETPPPPPKDVEDLGLSELKKLLKSEDPELRSAAALQLVIRGDKRARRILSKTLREGREEVALSILKVLTLQHDESYREPLIDVLEKRNPEFHPIIIQIFKYYERDDLIYALLERLEQKEKPIEEKKRILMALGKVRSKLSVEPLTLMFEIHEGKIDTEINTALEQITLQSIKTKEEWNKWWNIYKDKSREIWLDEAVSNYQRLLGEKNTNIEKLTGELVTLKKELLTIKLEQAKKLQPTEGVIPILLSALSDNHWQVQKFALEQLDTLPKENLGDILEKLIEMTSLSNEELKTTVITTLGDIGTKTAVPTLINIFNNQDEKITVRKSAALSLGKIGSQEATLPLTNMLKEGPSELVLAVIEALGNIKDKFSLTSLINCLEDKEKSQEIHLAIIDTLGEIKEPSSVGIIIKFTEDKREKFRWSAANSLGKIGSETALPALIKLLEDEFADIRQITVEAIGNIGTEKTIQPLIKTLLNDKDPRARELSTIALGKTKNKQSLPSLLNALTDTNEKVVQGAWNSIILIINSDLNLMIETAKKLEETNHISQAAQMYEKITETSDKPEYIQALLKCYKELGKLEETLNAYNNLLSKLSPDSAPWWELKIESINFLYAKKEYTRTIEEIKVLLNNNSITENNRKYLIQIKEDCEKSVKSLPK